jgi:DNA-binding response OmpR family regulator
MKKETKLVLVAEDEETVRSVLALFLTRAGFNVQTARDGLEALGHMRHRRFDAVIADYDMPRMNGLQFLALSRTLWPTTPVVVVSGDLSDEIAKLVMQRGAFTWLHKPYEMALVLEILRAAVRQPAEESVQLTASDVV